MLQVLACKAACLWVPGMCPNQGDVGMQHVIVVVQSALQPVPDKERYDWGLTNGVLGRG